jgi:predicted nucleotidyltransferase component of viral defense system
LKYSSASAFAQALSERLKRQALEEGIDPGRLRKQVAFERYLARLFSLAPSRWMLKGGYALELWLRGRARATKDIDLNFPPPPVEDLLDELQEAAELDLGDYFVFRVSRPRSLAGKPTGGFRFSVECLLAGKQFARFVLDVGQGEAPSGEPEWKDGQVDLGFADVPRVRIAVYPLADQFAEKLHAYTKPRDVRTRVKDLVDLTLILEVLEENLPSEPKVRRAIEATFGRSGTHSLPDPLPPPPEDWRQAFETMAEDLGLKSTDVELAHRNLEEYVGRLRHSVQGANNLLDSR